MNPAVPRPLLFEAGEERLAALDRLARSLWLGGLTNSQGTLEPRLAALAALHAALKDGVVPPLATWRWPPPGIAHPLHDALDGLGIAGFCAGQEELTNTVEASLLFHLDLIVDYQDRGASEQEARRMAIEAFVEDWSARCGEITELIEVFGLPPDDGKNTRWDRIHGLLRSSGWQEVLRIRRLLERLPELSRIIRALGRCRPTDEADAGGRVSVEVPDEAEAFRRERGTVRVPEMPGETRGICRSDRIARMLPAEAMLLGHPRLRLVWHARRAERTLLGYEDDDRMEELRLRRSKVLRPRAEAQPARRMEMGPILLCVDTSGSMQGGAEEVAKAVVLETMRTAHAQHRPCHVFAFGGADEVVDMALAVDSRGIDALIRFLGQGFRGGTDICGPLERVIAKLEDEQWRAADLLIASDGEFGATPALAARLDAVKRGLGLRVQGVLIGDRETVGFLEVADDIFPVRDWRRYGGSGGDSPIPSHRLTSMYFPGALRNEQNRQSTVSGDAAAATVLGPRRGEPIR